MGSRYRSVIEMQEIIDVKTLFSNLRSYEAILPQLPDRAKMEKNCPDPRQSKRNHNMTKTFLSSWIATEAVEESNKSAACSVDVPNSKESDISEAERIAVLARSADKLLKHGKRYMVQAIDETGSRKRQKFINSAAFIVGSMIRYHHLKMTGNWKRAKDELSKLHQEVLEFAKRRTLDVFQCQLAIKDLLERYRAVVVQKLDSMIHKQSEENQLLEEQKKIYQVKEISAQAANFYFRVMRSIADTCENIMGVPPCKYAIVGLSSLAKGEVTLYSDFDFVIVLENGVDEDSPFKEYFQWFTTFFHIIVIGFGETAIVDLDAGLISEFDDMCGISPDDTFPIAWTGKRNNTREFIQSVDTMVNYLSYEEEVKDGYFLSDLLGTTCFVHGDLSVYNDLYVQTRKRISQLSTKTRWRNILKPLCNSDGTVRTSAMFYRPLEVFLSCASSLFKCRAKSCFEIVAELKMCGFIDDDGYSILMYAVAVTMEIRLKTYGVTQKPPTYADAVKIVGEKSAADCYIALCSLGREIHRILSSGHEVGDEHSIIIPSRTSVDWKMDKLAFLTHLSRRREAEVLGLELAHQVMEYYENKKATARETKMSMKVILFKLMDILASNVSYPEKGRTIPDLEKMEWLSMMCLRLAEESDLVFIQTFHLAIWLKHFKQRRFKTALDEIDRWYDIWYSLGTSNRLRPGVTYLSISMEFMEVACVSEALDGDELTERIAQMMVGEKDYLRQNLLQISLCQALLKRGLKETANKGLEESIRNLASHSDRLQPFAGFFLTTIQTIQKNYGLTFDSQTQQHLRDMLTIENIEEKSIAWCTSCVRDDMQSPWYIVIRNTSLLSVYRSFSYQSMIKAIALMRKRHQIWKESDAVKSLVVESIIGRLMILLENIRRGDESFLLDQLYSARKELESASIIQPFLYACFADFLPQRTFLSINAKPHQQLFEIATQQNYSFKVLFGYYLCDSTLYRKAVDYFINFKFNSCIILLWTLLNFGRSSFFNPEKYIELLNTAILTVMIARKRQNPLLPLKKTKEISLAQYRYLKRRVRTPLLKNERWYESYIHSDSDPLVPVYNMAVEGLTYLGDRTFIALLWKIIHVSHASDSIRCASVESFVHHIAVLLRVFDSLGP